MQKQVDSGLFWRKSSNRLWNLFVLHFQKKEIQQWFFGFRKNYWIIATTRIEFERNSKIDKKLAKNTASSYFKNFIAVLKVAYKQKLIEKNLAEDAEYIKEDIIENRIIPVLAGFVKENSQNFVEYVGEIISPYFNLNTLYFSGSKPRAPTY